MCLGGLDTKIMFLLQIVTNLWPNFIICNFFPQIKLWELRCTPKHQPIAKKLYRSHFLPKCNTLPLGRSCLKKVEGSWCTLMLVGAYTNACRTETVLAIFPFNNKEAKRLHCPIHLPLMEHLQCFLYDFYKPAGVQEVPSRSKEI